MWWMNVVFPAPLSPSNPKTQPRGTETLTLSSANLGPYRRERFWVSIAGWVIGSSVMSVINLALALIRLI